MPATSIQSTLAKSIVRIYNNKNAVIGAGFLVNERNVLTCAHVVKDALGLGEYPERSPDGEITLDFPSFAKKSKKSKLISKVIFWRSLPKSGTDNDIAGLEILMIFPKMPSH
jgi:hypothetical protein